MEIIITMECVFCGKSHEVVVNFEDYLKWQDGEAIQRAMPYLSATQREQIISKICPACQIDIFGSGED